MILHLFFNFLAASKTFAVPIILVLCVSKELEYEYLTRGCAAR